MTIGPKESSLRSKLEFLVNASYGELRPLVETSQEFVPWTIAKNVSGWFQSELMIIEGLLDSVRAEIVANATSELEAENARLRVIAERLASPVREDGFQD